LIDEELLHVLKAANLNASRGEADPYIIANFMYIVSFIRYCTSFL